MTGLAAIIALPLAAQSTTNAGSRSAANTAVLAGVAVDSLRGSPLRGAQISVDGTTRFGLSDSTGAFRIDSIPPGQYRIGLFHSVLDSLGVGISSPPMSFRAGDSATVVLATPSPTTLIKALCHGPAPPVDSGSGPSVLIGRILDAETEQPIARARVALVWNDIEVNRTIGLRHIERTRDTVTGPAGTFQFCWVPSGLAATIHAARTYRSEVIDRSFDMADRYVGLVAIHLPGSAAAPGGAVLDGRVVRGDGRAVPGARVWVGGGADSGATTSDGRFALHGVPTGSRTLLVRAVGYIPATMPVELSVRQPQQVVVSLVPQAVVLKTVRVTAELQAGYRRIGFDRRQALGLGNFLNADDIARKAAIDFHDLLLNMPGMQVAATPNGTPYLVPTRGARCLLYVVDGHQFAQLNPTDIDTYVRPGAIAAIEVYQSGQVPSELVTGPGAGCAVVMIWTKIFLGVH